MKSSKIKTCSFLFLSLLIVAAPATRAFAAPDKQTAEVYAAISGDTLELKSGKKLKLIGVEAPPMQSVVPLLRQYGAEAQAYAQSLMAGKTITVEWGSQIRDSQQRVLGYVFLEDGTFVNKEMLAHGHGKFIMPPPNKKYSGDLRRAELNARRDRLGLWKEEAQNPFIKNEYIGEKNTKIYYFPTSPELDRIPAAQLVTFKSRVEAKAAGYRPCSTCKEEENAPSWY